VATGAGFREDYTITMVSCAVSRCAALPAGGISLLVFNASPSIVHISFHGDATVANFPIPPGGSRLLNIGPLDRTASVILDSGTGTAYLSRGDGETY